VHMNPAEAVQAHLDLLATESVGMHFGTFQLTTEGIDEPLRALEEARRARLVLQLGQPSGGDVVKAVEKHSAHGGWEPLVKAARRRRRLSF